MDRDGERAQQIAVVRLTRPEHGAPSAVAYFYSPDRTGAHPAAHLAGFKGLLQADAYAGFEKLYGPARAKLGTITEVACWAHPRRGFFEDWEQHKSPTPKHALDRTAAIYAIEARAAFALTTERAERRRELAPLLDDFFAWANATVAKLAAKFNLAEAFRYALNRREAWSRFVTDGRLETDNNIAVGRKNYLFAGSDTGAERTASICTIVRTAKRSHVNPETCNVWHW